LSQRFLPVLLSAFFAGPAFADPAPQTEAGEAGPVERTLEEMNLEFTGLLQTRYQLVERDEFGVNEDTLLVRRARAQIELEPMDRLLLVLEGELASQTPIRDAFARYRFHRMLEITAGHFKRPFGATELDSGWEVPTSERGLASDRLRTANLAGRDVGAMIGGRWKKALDLRWAIGAFDGEGGEAVEDVAGRLSISPGPVTIGGAATYSRGRRLATTGTTYDPGLREAWAYEGDVTLDLDVAFARVEVFAGENRERTHDNHFGRFFGVSALAMARIALPGCVRLEPGGKIERFDSSVTFGDDAVMVVSPFVRTQFGEHLQLLVEGNFVIADDFITPTFVPPQRTLVIQLGART
jgi:hypothetical protein